MGKRVLIVDDSLYMRTMICEIVTGAGYEVVGQAGDGESAIDMALELQPDLITLDNILPDMIGTDILQVLKEGEKIGAKVIMISAVGQESVVKEGLRLGADAYIVKPFTIEGLVDTINRVMHASPAGQ